MNKTGIIVFSFLLTIGGIGSSYVPIFAAEQKSPEEQKTPDYIMDTSDIGNSDNGVLRSEQLLELGSVTPGALSIEGEQSLRQGSLNRALTVLQRSVELAPLDMDVRILYAQTLEKKLAMQKDKRDPKLFNFLVKQWLFVYNKAEFYDQKMLGLNAVFTLTGTKPKRWENNTKFLARVLRDENNKPKVAVKDKQPPKKLKKKSDDDDNFDLDTELTQSKQQPY
jgi:hypothetical protein